MNKIDAQKELVKSKIEELLKNTSFVMYGEITFVIKIHDSRIVAITNSVTENTIQKIKGEKE